MGQKVSPVVAAIVVILVAVVAIFAVMKLANRDIAGSREGEKPPGMPPDVAREFQKRGAAASGPGAQPSKPALTPGQMPTAPTAP